MTAHSEISFYLDENLSPEIAVQLQLRGIKIIRGPLGIVDREHFARAHELDWVLCTEDSDFCRLHSAGMQHAGIIKGENGRHDIGDWVKFLLLVHATCSADEMRNKLIYLFSPD